MAKNIKAVGGTLKSRVFSTNWPKNLHTINSVGLTQHSYNVDVI